LNNCALNNATLKGPLQAVPKHVPKHPLGLTQRVLAFSYFLLYLTLDANAEQTACSKLAVVSPTQHTKVSARASSSPWKQPFRSRAPAVSQEFSAGFLTTRRHGAARFSTSSQPLLARKYAQRALWSDAARQGPPPARSDRAGQRQGPAGNDVTCASSRRNRAQSLSASPPAMSSSPTTSSA
jgi:hypothetical protein